MTDLFAYPNTPGAQPSDTSRAAGASMAKAAPKLREAVLKAFEKSKGMTADECAGRLGLSILSIRPRVTELSRLGKLRDSGERRANGSGRKAAVWVPVFPAGLRGQRQA